MTSHSNFEAFEHYRMHIIELWPGGPEKEVALQAVRSALDGLRRARPSGTVPFQCSECRRRLALAANSSRPGTVTCCSLAA